MPFRLPVVAAATLLMAAPIASSQDAPPVSVSVAPVQVGPQPVLLHGLGSVAPYQSVLVRARVDGTLDRVNFIEGQNVRAGDVLAQIDPRPYRAALDQAQAKRGADQAQLANAKLDLDRYSSLMSREFASRQSVDTQRAQVAQLTAAIEGDDAAIATAQLNLDFCGIISPIDGKVGLRMVDAGNLIHASDQQGIVSVAQIQPISVVFSLPQDALPHIQDAMRDAAASGGLPVAAYTSDDRDKIADGVLLTPDNAIDAATGTIKLKATFRNEDRRLWPGQFVMARLRLRVLPDARSVPSVAIQHGPSDLYAYVVQDDGMVARRTVTLTQDDGQTAVVASGLSPGERVVTAGQSRVQAGVRVTVAAAGTAS